MRHGMKILVLGSLVAVSTGLSLTLFGLRGAQAASAFWMAADPARATDTLLRAGGLTYQDHVYMPGTYAGAYMPVGLQGLGPAAPKSLTYNSKMYTAGKMLDPSHAYAKQNPLPQMKVTPKRNSSDLPAVQFMGLNGTKFMKNEPAVVSKTSSDQLKTTAPVKTNKLSTDPAVKFAIKLKSDTKNGKIALTRAQLRAFQIDLRNAMRLDGINTVKAVFPGSLNDQLAAFELGVRLRSGTPTDVRIKAKKTR
jgi:hypothetical protein